MDNEQDPHQNTGQVSLHFVPDMRKFVNSDFKIIEQEQRSPVNIQIEREGADHFRI
jgi:hypothetical protein